MAIRTGLIGTEVLTATGTPLVTGTEMDTIAIIGTAPDADPNIFPLNEPVLLKNEPRKAAALDATGNGLGTLLDNMNLIYKQAGAMTVITRVEEGADIDATLTNVVGSASSMSVLFDRLKVPD